MSTDIKTTRKTVQMSKSHGSTHICDKYFHVCINVRQNLAIKHMHRSSFRINQSISSPRKQKGQPSNGRAYEGRLSGP